MIEARATVLRVEDGMAWIKVSDKHQGCGRCDEPGGCRSIKLAYSLRPPESVFSLPDSLGLSVGEPVRLRMHDSGPLMGALGSYGLGALLMISGAALGHFLASPGREDLLALAGLLAGLVGAYGLNRLFYRSRRWRGALELELVRDDGRCQQDGRE